MMPRRPRIVVPGIPLHIIQRGNNRQACFFADDDYHRYLEWLTEYAAKSDCTIHAYVLMTNHVHLLLTPGTEDAAGLLMKRLGQRYVQYINRSYRRSGTLWEGRFRSCLSAEENYILACYRYIELNPVRAKMVLEPADYPWSSFRSNALGEPSDLLTPHPAFLGFSSLATEWHSAYLKYFGSQPASEIENEIRAATNGNFALGSSRFQAEIEATLGRRVSRGRSGRPLKKKAPNSGDLFVSRS